MSVILFYKDNSFIKISSKELQSKLKTNEKDKMKTWIFV